MKHTLRPYQDVAVKQIQEHYRAGRKKVLLHLDTGGGKTTVFCNILQSVATKEKRAIMVVHGRKLVKQASERLLREGVDHGVLMANHDLYRPLAPIQICSIDTLHARDLRPEADLIVIDEAHMATSSKWFSFLEKYKDGYFLPVTATPYTPMGLGHIAEAIVKPTNFDELVDEGFLVPPRYFAPSIPDLKGVRSSKSMSGTDYVSTELEKVMNNPGITADIITNWEQAAEERKTLLFAASVNHSKAVAEAYNRRGIKWAHVDAHTPDNQREDLIGDLREGRIYGLSNVGILCTGVDIPEIGCITMTRPTQSYNLYIQQAGRGTRPFKDKEDFILLDHAGNICRHGFINQDREANLEPATKKIVIPKVHICEKCFTPFEGNICHACGFMIKVAKRKTTLVQMNDGSLVEIYEDEIMVDVKRLKKIAREKKYKRGWVYHRLLEKHGIEVADKFHPKRKLPTWLNQ